MISSERIEIYLPGGFLRAKVLTLFPANRYHWEENTSDACETVAPFVLMKGGDDGKHSTRHHSPSSFTYAFPDKEESLAPHVAVYRRNERDEPGTTIKMRALHDGALILQLIWRSEKQLSPAAQVFRDVLRREVYWKEHVR